MNMDFVKHISKVSAILMALVVFSSCERELADMFGRRKSGRNVMKVSVSSNVYSETKSACAGPVLTRTFGDDDFSISEYVCDIEDVMDMPGTRGSIVTTTGINADGQSFTVDGWGMISPARGEPQELTNHLPKLTATYTSGQWPWAGGANPKWVNEANLHIWSYYPAGKIDPTITIDDTTDANNKAKFSYTTDNTDLLIAYNKEYREFKKDAAGNHTYDPVTGEITDDMVAGQSESFKVNFYHALAAIEFELSAQMKADKVDVKKITMTTSDGGFYTSGSCAVTGPSLAKPTSDNGTGGVVWTPTGSRSTIENTYDPSSASINGGYASSTGNGVLFFIPQSLSSATATVTISVEFCKNGSTATTTRTKTFTPGSGFAWEAGKYYKYVFDGEIHVPGEILFGAADLNITKFNNYPTQKIIKNGDTVQDIKVKGVKAIGMVLDGYYYKDNNAATVVLLLAENGVLPTETAAQIVASTQTNFQYDFQPVTLPASTVVGGSATYGDSSNDTGYYHNYYVFDYINGTTDKKVSGVGVGITDRMYYVFSMPDGCNTFNIAAVASSGNASADFTAHVAAIMVLEVENS